MSYADHENDDHSMILVCHFGGKSWVIEDADWFVDWEAQAQTHIANPEKRFMYDRRKALVLAHNIQNRVDSENGVWEIFLKKEEDSDKNVTSKDKKDNNKGKWGK